MRCENKTIVSCLFILSLLALVGCSKKASEDESASATSVKTVDTEKPVSQVQAEAETMSNEDLKAMAIKYKEAILAKQDQIKDLVAKIKEIPITEASGQEAQSLKTDLKSIESTLTAMKDRFQVYYDKLKENGGSLSGLEL